MSDARGRTVAMPAAGNASTDAQAADAAMQPALAAHRAGRLDEAALAYRSLLDDAVTPLQLRATALANLAAIHSGRAHYPDAMRCFGAALELDPTVAAVWSNLGNLQQRVGDADEAIRCYEEALRLQPGLEPARRHLVDLLRRQGEVHLRRSDAAGALAIFRQLDAWQPGEAATCFILGAAARTQGDLALADREWQRCIALDPDHLEALIGLGVVAQEERRHDDAVRYLSRALQVRPGHADASARLAATLIKAGAIGRALDLLEPALAAHPAHPDLLGVKALALVYQARVEEGLEVFAELRRRQPDNRIAIDNSLLAALYSDRLSAADLLRLHLALAPKADAKVAAPAAATAAAPLAALASGADAVATPPGVRNGRRDRRLRIGYLSPDFRSHPVAHFIEPVFRQHDADRFHVTAYALPCAPDATTARLRALTQGWRDLGTASAEGMAALIREDGIDLLVDLAGYTSGGRMDLLARRPAPIQASFLGYSSTTGLPAIDYLIADRHLIPPEHAPFYSECIVRLDRGLFCYPPWPAVPPVVPLPALANGCVTFASFNALPKISARCLDLWAQVLQAVPTARLTLITAGFADAGTRARFARHFATRGVDPERVAMRPSIPSLAGFLAAYGAVDIALDTVPYNGGTTTCDALWMGVPVVTLAGGRYAARMGASVLNSAGHAEWIAADAADYVRIAVGLASDLPALAGIRSALRAQVQDSRLADAAAYTSCLEAAYLQMQEARIGGRSDAPDSVIAP